MARRSADPGSGRSNSVPERRLRTPILGIERPDDLMIGEFLGADLAVVPAVPAFEECRTRNACEPCASNMV